ncbi:MAG: PAS domain S-box protein [Syntrophobacter sp.]
MNGSGVMRPKGWAKRYVVTGMTILIGFICSILAFAMVSDWERHMLRVSFELAAKNRIETIQREIDSDLHTLSSLKAFYDSLEKVDRSQFKIFAKPLLLPHPSVHAIEWIPRVRHAERMDYELAARVDGIPDFRIWERDAQNRVQNASERSDYFPVYFAEPYKGNEAAFGFDLGSNPARRAALEEARDRGAMAATGRVSLVQETGGQYATLVFVPLYHPDTADDTRKVSVDALRGFVLGVFRVGNMVERALAYLSPEAIELAIYDRSGPEEESLLSYHAPSSGASVVPPRDIRSAGNDGNFEHVGELRFADRIWCVVLRSTPAFAPRGKRTHPWEVFGAGLLLTVVLAGYLVVHKRNEDALRESEEKYRHLFDMESDGLFLVDDETGRIMEVNSAGVMLYGYSREELLRMKREDLMTDGGLAGDPMPECGHCSNEHYRRKKDGTIFLVEITGRNFLWKGRRMYVAAVRDITKRKQAEIELRQANDYLENIFQNSPDGIGIVDRDGRFLKWNRMAAEQYGYSTGELEGRLAFEFYADRDELELMLEELRRHAAIRRYAIDMKKKDGTIATFELSISLLRDNAGKTLGSVCVARDMSDIKKAVTALEASNERLQREIAERERVAETLRESERRFREILENIHLLAVSLDVEGRITFCNDFLLSATGWSRGELLGHDWFDVLLPPELSKARRQTYQDKMTRGEVETHDEEEIVTCFGKTSLISWDNTLLRDPRGKVIGVTKIGRDIGLRRKMEKELREASAEMELLIVSIPSILIELSDEYRIIRWNSAAERNFGIPAEDVMGRPLHECPFKWDWEKISEGLSICCNKGNHLRLEDVSFVRPDGKEGLLSLVISPIKSELDEFLGLIILGADTTERRLLERQLVQAQKLESIGQLAAGIAHEINTPTQYVGDNTRFLLDAFTDLERLLDKYAAIPAEIQSGKPVEELIQEMASAEEEADLEYLREEIPRAIQQSLEGVERVSRIVGAMKEFSHPGTTEKAAIDINKAIESTITVARNEWKYVADLVTDLDTTMPFIFCLPGEVNQVILNMIINAAHALADAHDGEPGKKGTITVSTHNLGDRAEIHITDTGTGIPENIRSRIFDPFFTTKEVGKGTGQGLAIAHSVIVEKHGGSISFETEMGKGTTFIVSLPIIDVQGLKGGSE